jgi:hypothetical protein
MEVDPMSSRDIIAICDASFPKFFDDCAGFVKSVAQQCGVFIVGNANSIVESLLTGRANLTSCSEPEAIRQAQVGNLVIGGLSASGHGHVVVVVDGPASHGHAYAYWGRYHGLKLKGFPEFNVGAISLGRGPITHAFKHAVLPNIKYAWIRPSAFLLRQNQPNDAGSRGRLLF